VEHAGLAGLFHDIGKTRTPLGIIRKPGQLTPEEWLLVRAHPVHSKDIVNRMDAIPSPVPSMVYEHHMRPDGGGYPSRTHGKTLHPLSPLITVSDVYDAITSHRPYNSPLPLPAAIESMLGMRGIQFPPQVLDAFVAMMGVIPVGSVVRLVSGDVAVVSKLGPGGEIAEGILVAGPDGKEIPGEMWVVRSLRPSDVAGGVSPLSRRIDPVRVLQSQPLKLPS
jgi:HD-GYP domain-containing protein (c-di-GMP phosphodiesterase class II)